MNKRYKENIIVAITIIIVLGIIYFSDFSFTTFTGLAIFETGNQNDFSNGTYNNTEWNVNSIRLSANNLSGTYTSQIFDVERNATWNNISWSETLTSLSLLIAVDAQSDVWKGNNSGASWTLIEDDFNNGEGNDPRVMIVDTNNSLYIAEGDHDVWQSTNLGITWTKVNDDYNSAEIQDPKVGISDNNSNLFIIEGDEDVWQSNDSGSTWVKVATNINGGNDNVKGIVSMFFITDLTFQVRSCSISDCSDSSFSGSYTTPVKEDLSIANNRYFQYKAFFTSNNTDVSSLLFNVSIDYTLIDYFPVLSLQSPTNNYNSTGNITFSCSASDDNGLDSILLYHNITGSFIANETHTLTGTSNTTNFTINSLSNGTSFIWNCRVYDTIFQSAWGENRSISITTDTQGPSITLLTPANNSIWSSSNLVTFTYNVSDANNISNCSLIINDNINLTSTTLFNSFTQTLTNNNYNWSINCTDEYNNANRSDTWLLTVDYSTSSNSNTGSSNQNTISPEDAPARTRISCTEDWTCSDWSACINGLRTRTCTDANNCGTTNNKPAEEEDCSTEIINGESITENTVGNPFSRLTGLITLDNITYFAKDNYLAFIFLFGVGIIYLNYRLNLFNRIKRKIKGKE